MDIFGGVDGTSAEENAEYKVIFDKSFTNLLHKNWANPYSSYVRGPFSAGVWTGFLARHIYEKTLLNYRAMEQVRSNIHSGNIQLSEKVKESNAIADMMKAPRIFLAGYSRGGAAVVEICRMLKKEGVPVHCLILFDAVAMTDTVSQRKVPSNVRYCFHAMRDAGAGSREMFDLDLSGRVCESQDTTFFSREFMCTHGGMGGTLWKEGSTDDRGYIVEASPFETQVTSAAFGPLAAQINRQTNITPAMDEANSKKVASWMKAQIGLAMIRNTRVNKATLDWMRKAEIRRTERALFTQDPKLDFLKR